MNKTCEEYKHLTVEERLHFVAEENKRLYAAVEAVKAAVENVPDVWWDKEYLMEELTVSELIATLLEANELLQRIKKAVNV